MKLEGRKCRFKGCKNRILTEPMSMGEDSPLWVVKGLMGGYCMKCSLREFSNLVPVINPDPNEEFEYWSIIDGVLTPLVPKEEDEK